MELVCSFDTAENSAHTAVGQLTHFIRKQRMLRFIEIKLFVRVPVHGHYVYTRKRVDLALVFQHSH